MEPMGERPDYKSHPLWLSAIALAREAYAVAEELLAEHPEVSRRLRKAAVSVPAHVAGALSAEPGARREDMLAARGALAEVSRQAARVSGEGPGRLARRAEELDRLVLFEFGAAEAVS